MTAINHALTGTAIGLLVGEPLLAIPLAVASHYVCDALPHFKVNLPEKVVLKSNLFRSYLVAEAGACFMLVVLLSVAQPQHWFIASTCAFLAAAPDFFSINRYLRVRAGKKWKPSLYAKFAGGIQWFERPIGGFVEVAWLVAAVVVILPFIVR